MNDLESKKNLIKKLTYLSNNRGFRENDIILGEFSKSYLNELNEIELNDYSNFLNETDPDIFDWICKKKPLPTKYQNSIISKLIEMHNKG